MKEFCSKFWKDFDHKVDKCPKCRAAAEEAARQMEIPVVIRTTEEKDKLDCHGRP